MGTVRFEFGGEDLLTDFRDSNLYTISIYDLAASSPVFLMSKATSTKSWLWNRRLSHLNFGTINHIMKKDLVDGLLKFKYDKYHLCSACEQAEAIATACFTHNRSLVYTRYNKTPYELIKGRKPNVQYFHMFGSLCYPTNDRDELGKMKPKADIDSSKDSNAILSKEDVDNLFGPLYEEYNEMRSQEVSNNSAANTLDKEDTPSSSLIVVEENEAPQIVTSLEEPVANEPTTPVSNDNADESVQEDVAVLDRNVFYNLFHTPVFEEAESSSTFQDPSNMHEFHQKHHFTDRWTKNHPIEQVIGDPSKPLTTRSRHHTNVEMCMYALTVSTTELTNIKEAMLDHSRIKSMQDELNQFKRLDVWELVARLADRNIIKARLTEKHCNEVKRIFHYLKHSINMGLWCLKDSGFELIAYSDADHAWCHDDCKSTSGRIQFLVDKLVSWSSKKHDCTAMSTAKAEYVTLYACCAQVIWMRTKLLDYGYRYTKIPMYCNSKSAIAISWNPVQHSRTKHINVRYHFIKEHVKQGTIELYFVGTEYQLADLFTKALPKERFEYLVHRIVDDILDDLLKREWEKQQCVKYDKRKVIEMNILDVLEQSIEKVGKHLVGP
ncbi:retrovirus-related pol polyprotein from transposon TNT 1-94 [Tanacetum coccineum]